MTFKYLWPAFIWTLVLFLLSVIPGRELPNINFWEFDKFIHLGVYMLLSGLWMYGLSRQYQADELRSNVKLAVLAGCSSYGILIEIIQETFIDNRFFDYFDIFANIIGSALGILLIPHLLQKISQRGL